MAWSSGTYTKGNSATGGWSGDASTGIGIEAGRHDTQDNDFATGINTCLTKDGQNTPTANLPMGGYKHTGVGNAVNSDEYTSLGQVRAGIDTLSATLSTTATRYSNDSTPPRYTFQKNRSTTSTGNTIVQAGDTLGQILFAGANGTGYTFGAAIACDVDGTPGATNDMPGNLRFFTTPDGSGTVTERMRIDNVGNVGIGAVPAGQRLYVSKNSAATTHTAIIESAASGDLSTGAGLFRKYDNNTTTSQVLLQFQVNAGATLQGQINANGASQAAFGSYSDARLKENIVNLPTQLANIMGLRPVEFDYKDGSGHQIGFIAQEVQQIYPDLVGQNTDGYLTLTGLGRNEARMIKAFQEFAAQVQEKFAQYEARIAALEA